MYRRDAKRIGPIIWTMPLALSVALSGCANKPTTVQEHQTEQAVDAESATTTDDESTDATPTQTEKAAALTVADIEINETISDDADESHAILADGESLSYANIEVLKTGAADGDEADFYGTNAAVFATNGGTLDLTDVVVSTDGMHANAVFSYGEGSTVNIAHSFVETSNNCSGGIMVTGGGTLNASDVTVHTTGNSSAAIRSDRGGGIQNVSGGSYTTEGTGSPAIYSTADVRVSGATLVSTASEGVVVEGKNSVSLTDVNLTASNTTKNSDKSNWYEAVMIYQSMSGDAAEGEAHFSMAGGSLTNKNGDIFFVNNTVAAIDLSGVDITNEDPEGVFMRLAAAGWGTEGSNGGHVTLTASGQTIEGDVLVDSVSELNAYLKDGSSLTGALNPANEGAVYLEIEDGSAWTLTRDSYVTGLTCGAGAINLNGHTLYVDGVAYEEGSENAGTAIEFTLPEGGMGMGGPGGGPGGEPSAAPPDGGPGGPGGPGGEPPAKPDGEPGEPPAKPGE